MKNICIGLLLIVCSVGHAQEVLNEKILSINNLAFLEGTWKAVAKDSTFSSVMKYSFSPKRRFLEVTNQLYGKDGNLFAEYEGFYLIENKKLTFLTAGPRGETHKGYAEISRNTVTHKAKIIPGNSIKSYKSELVLKNDKLFYYASYSKDEVVPDQVDYSNPLIYDKLSIGTFDTAKATKYGADDYGMRKYVIAFLKRGPNREPDKEKASALQRAHMKNILRLEKEGKLSVAGPFFGDGELRGIYIFNVESIKEAEELTNSDPAIQAGTLQMELLEWYGSAALMEIKDLHKTIARKNIIE